MTASITKMLPVLVNLFAVKPVMPAAQAYTLYMLLCTWPVHVHVNIFVFMGVECTHRLYT